MEIQTTSEIRKDKTIPERKWIALKEYKKLENLIAEWKRKMSSN